VRHPRAGGHPHLCDGAAIRVAYGAVLLFLYALGCAVPVVLAGTFTGVLKNLRTFGRWNDLINKVAGVLLILVGVYFLWVA